MSRHRRLIISGAALFLSGGALVAALLIPCPPLYQRWLAHQDVAPLSQEVVPLRVAVDALVASIDHRVPMFVCQDLPEKPVSLVVRDGEPLVDVVERLAHQVGGVATHYHGVDCPAVHAFPHINCVPFAPRGRMWDRAGVGSGP